MLSTEVLLHQFDVDVVTEVEVIVGALIFSPLSASAFLAAAPSPRVVLLDSLVIIVIIGSLCIVLGLQLRSIVFRARSCRNSPRYSSNRWELDFLHSIPLGFFKRDLGRICLVIVRLLHAIAGIHHG